MRPEKTRSEQSELLTIDISARDARSARCNATIIEWVETFEGECCCRMPECSIGEKGPLYEKN